MSPEAASLMASFPARSFDFVMADPPWHHSGNSIAKPGRNPRRHYRTLPLDRIMAIGPAVKIVAAVDAILWLWTTNPHLEQAFQVMHAWGFRYSSSGVWVKLTKTGKVARGTGQRLIGSSEPFIIARRGSPRTIPIPSAILAQRLRHSEKPPEAFQQAEVMMPGARRLELFSRTTRPFWNHWGDEAGRFDAAELEAS